MEPKEPHMKFGVFDHMDRGGPDLASQYRDRLQLIEAYDRAGFYGYHLAEHHGTPLGLAPSPSVFLSAVAQRTRRLRFGPMVYTLSLYHPLRILEEICMLDQLSEGRLELGIGRGISPIELGFFGVDADIDAQPRYEEALEIILQGLTEGRVRHEGTYYNFQDYPLELRTVQLPRPPLWYGVSRTQTVEWAAERRICAACNGSNASVRKITDHYRAEWERLGRDQDELPLLAMNRHIVVADSEREAYEDAREAYSHWFASLVHLWRLRGTTPPYISFPEQFDDAVSAGYCIVGTPATVRDRLLQDVEEAGVNYLLGRLAFGNLPIERSLRSVELLETEVLPAVGALHTIPR
jgi:alkanesulfonate monooxygenase SsuD/methylene tetrahydromethanopterin reductase-like flavin-dependent oxidoreductase (luciferase family)